MSALPSIGRAARIDPPVAPGADQTQSLYERFAGQIFGYCLHQLGSREEAEDAVQTTFMNAFRGLQRGIVPEVESAWLFKIAHNVCLSRRRSAWRRGRVEAPNNMEVLQEVIPARGDGGDDLIGLQDVLEQMPEGQRRAILLREWQGLSYHEIAEELQLSQAAVETLIFRARRALAAGLQAESEPAPTWRRRARHGIDASGLIGALKALLTGGAAVKVAATGVAVTTAVVAATQTHHQRRHVTVHVAAPVQRTVVQPSAPPVRVVHTTAPVRHAAPVVHHVAPKPTRNTPVAIRPTTTPVSVPVTPTPTPMVAPSPPPQAHTWSKPEPARGATHKDTPAPPAASTPAASAKQNHGRGHDKTRDTQSTAQPVQPAVQGTDQQPEPAKDNGRGHK